MEKSPIFVYPQSPSEKPLSSAARRALAEAAERQRAQTVEHPAQGSMKEIQGRGGLDPVRYHDWEVKGIASDF